ncbi:hypothetical protein D3C80_1628180 [compost metagenome]
MKTADGFTGHDFECAAGVQPWVEINYRDVFQSLSEAMQLEPRTVSQRYGEVTLRTGEEDRSQEWRYHPILGVFREYF